MREESDLQEWQVEKIQRGIRQADAGEFATDEEVATVFERYRQVSPSPGEGVLGGPGEGAGG